jgi:hypothetical protein
MPRAPEASVIVVGSGAISATSAAGAVTAGVGMCRSISRRTQALHEHSGTVMPVWGQVVIRIP